MLLSKRVALVCARALALAILVFTSTSCGARLFTFVNCDHEAPGQRAAPLYTTHAQGQSALSLLQRSGAVAEGLGVDMAAQDSKITLPHNLTRLGQILASRNNEAVRSLASEGDQMPVSGRAHHLTRRWARAKVPRVQLAQRPPKSTTTSTTTSTTSAPTTSAQDKTAERVADGDNQEDDQESAGSDDYETIERPKSKVVVMPKPSEKSPREDETEESEEEEEISSTTTTTQKPRRSKGAPKGKGAPKKVVQTTTTTTTTTTSSPREDESEPEGEEDVEEKEEEKEVASTSRTKQVVAESRPEQGKSAQNETQGPVEADQQRKKKKPLVLLPFIKTKNSSVCTPEAYKEFPRDLIGDKWRSRGFVLLHVLVVCYMFYSLALVCERYFMPSLEEFAQRLQLSEDVAGATLMSAGSSAPELFTAILGVFVAKGDVGTGAIVGSAVFNILFVIGLCAFVSTTSAQLQWWPVMRDSVYYTFTVLVLIIIIYDERITAFESATMILLYGVYIAIMVYNEPLKQLVSGYLLSNRVTAKLISSNSLQVDGPDDVFGNISLGSTSSYGTRQQQQQYEPNNGSALANNKTVEDDSIFMASQLVIVKHKRLFRSTLRFQAAARYIIIKRQHRALRQQQKLAAAQSRTEEVNYFGPESDAQTQHSSAQRAKMEAYARSATVSKQKFSIVSKDDYEFWHRPPDENENYYLWLARIPVNYVLHYTVPDCTLYPDKYIITFVVSIIWTAVFSYIMVWMITLIGYTLGIPDSVMGITFLAAGTSVPDCYSSLHAARNGMADMAVSNSIGSNVFDILIGLSVPWFIQSAIYPGIVATVNSRGVIYSVILLFLSLIVTIYLLNKYDWSLQPRLGLALLIAYGLFIILTSMLEFNLFGHVNPPPC